MTHYPPEQGTVCRLTRGQVAPEEGLCGEVLLVKREVCEAGAGRGLRTKGFKSPASGRLALAGDRGFEPRLPDPESGVLPLD